MRNRCLAALVLACLAASAAAQNETVEAPEANQSYVLVGEKCLNVTETIRNHSNISIESSLVDDAYCVEKDENDSVDGNDSAGDAQENDSESKKNVIPADFDVVIVEEADSVAAVDVEEPEYGELTSKGVFALAIVLVPLYAATNRRM